MQLQLIIIILVALVLIFITVQNPNPVTVQFLSWDAQGVPLIVIILISMMSGIIISSILSLFKQAKLKDKIRALQREIDDLKYPSLNELESENIED